MRDAPVKVTVLLMGCWCGMSWGGNERSEEALLTSTSRASASMTETARFLWRVR